MLSARPAPRTSMCTWRQLLARNTAACPAELPPPTIDDFLARRRASPRGGWRRSRRPGRRSAAARRIRARGTARRWRRRPICARDLAPVGRARSRKAGASSRGARACAATLTARAELLRLHERAAGERAAGDAGREAEVVLDLRAGAGLPAVGDRLDHQHVEALGGGVDRGGEPGGSGADHHQVVHAAPRRSPGSCRGSRRARGCRGCAARRRGASTTGTSSARTPWRHEQRLARPGPRRGRGSCRDGCCA